MLMAAWSGADCALAIVAVARHHMQAAATRLRNSEPRVIVRTVSNSSAVPFSRTPARFYRSRANALTGWLHRGGNRNPLNSLARSFASSDGARLALPLWWCFDRSRLPRCARSPQPVAELQLRQPRQRHQRRCRPWCRSVSRQPDSNRRTRCSRWADMRPSRISTIDFTPSRRIR